jgi:hypothetical protein
MASARDAKCGHRSRFNNGDQTPAETYKYVMSALAGGLSHLDEQRV